MFIWNVYNFNLDNAKYKKYCKDSLLWIDHYEYHSKRINELCFREIAMRDFEIRLNILEIIE
jgi:hypothetical protein